jgi:hypothetical protein
VPAAVPEAAAVFDRVQGEKINMVDPQVSKGCMKMHAEFLRVCLSEVP